MLFAVHCCKNLFYYFRRCACFCVFLSGGGKRDVELWICIVDVILDKKGKFQKMLTNLILHHSFVLFSPIIQTWLHHRNKFVNHGGGQPVWKIRTQLTAA